MFTLGIIFLPVGGKGTGLFSMWHSTEALCLLSWMSARESISFGGTYYSLTKQFLFVEWGRVMTKEVIHILSLCLRVVRFLAFQESVNQAVEEGPQVLQIYSSEGSSRHPRGWASHSDFSTRAGVLLAKALSKCLATVFPWSWVRDLLNDPP